MPTRWTRRARAFIRYQRMKFNAYLEREKKLDAVQPYDPGAGFALFLFLLVWIIALEFGTPPK